MEDESRDMAQAYETTPEETKEDPRELPDKELEDIAGGTIPIIDAF